MMRQRPQRILASAPIGSLLKGAERFRPEPRVQDDGAYLTLIRQLPCLKCGMDPAGEAAHVRLNSGTFNKRQAMARKPDPKWTVPLCRDCHQRDRDALHRTGELLFWRRLGINPFPVCERLFAARGDLVRMRAVALQTIAERGQ